MFIEKLLERMEFQKEKRANYDPHHIISLRKQANKKNPFDHQVVEGLNETANLFHFMEIPRSDENASTIPIAISPVTEGPNILVKRSLSKFESMEVEADDSHKKARLFQDDKTLSHVISDDLKRVVLVPTKSVQVNQFYFKDVNNSELSLVFKSKEELMASYVEKRKQSLEETRNLLPRVRSFNNPKNSLISTRDIERNTFKLAMVSDKKMSEMEVKLYKISVPDKI